MERAEWLGLAAGSRVARLGMVTADGVPTLVPITFAFDGGDLVTAVDHKPKRTRWLRRLDLIAANPAVSVLVDHWAEDWERLWWVRIDGTARIEEAGDAFASGIAALVARYRQYTAVPPRGPLVRVLIERVTGWRADA